MELQSRIDLQGVHDTPCLLLSVSVPDVSRLLMATSNVADQCPSSDVTAKAHGTNWTKPTGEVRQWSLYNRKLDTSWSKCDHDCVHGDGKELSPVLPACFHAWLIRCFPMLTNLRLNMLGPGAALAPHRENTVVMVDGRKLLKARFHLPVQTSEWAFSRIGNKSYRMEQGRVYFFNNRMVHAAWNVADTPRYHLVWDALVCRKLYERLGGAVRVEPFGDLPELKPTPERAQYPLAGEYAWQRPPLNLDGIEFA